MGRYYSILTWSEIWVILIKTYIKDYSATLLLGKMHYVFLDSPNAAHSMSLLFILTLRAYLEWALKGRFVEQAKWKHLSET